MFRGVGSHDGTPTLRYVDPIFVLDASLPLEILLLTYVRLGLTHVGPILAHVSPMCASVETLVLGQSPTRSRHGVGPGSTGVRSAAGGAAVCNLRLPIEGLRQGQGLAAGLAPGFQ